MQFASYRRQIAFPLSLSVPAGRSSKSNIQGSIRLKAWLSTREDRGLDEEEEMWNEIRQQEKIFTVFMDHQVRECQVYVNCSCSNNGARCGNC